VRQQALDGEVRLAGVGGAEDGFDARGESGHAQDGWGSAGGLQADLRAGYGSFMVGLLRAGHAERAARGWVPALLL
jgi:hypothetical protein